jgi:C_GCAxxG_C_C family probable redox protein
MSAKSEQVVRKFRKGFNCSQAVLSVYAEEFGLCRETALKIACGFGGGMGRMALTCGAVTGAFMVIGLKYGNVDANEKEIKEKTYGLVREFARRFEKCNGSSICRELLGCDISEPEGLRSAKENGLFTSVCPGLVQDAVEILEEMMNE